MLRAAQEQQQQQQACSAAASGLSATAAAAPGPVPTLPPLQHCSEDEAVASLQELAGSHSLASLSASIPTISNSQVLLKSLWQARVPSTRAAWLLRVLYMHWVQGMQDNQPDRAMLQAVGPLFHVLPGHAPEMDLRPATLQRCAMLWTAHVLGHMEDLAQAVSATAPGGPGSTTAGVGSSTQALNTPSYGGSAGASTAAGSGGAGGGPSTLALAADSLASAAAPLLEPGPDAKLLYFGRLAAHTFAEGMGDAPAVLAWATKHLALAGAGAGAEVGSSGGAVPAVGAAAAAAAGEGQEVRVQVALALLQATVQVGAVARDGTGAWGSGHTARLPPRSVRSSRSSACVSVRD